MNIGFVGIVLGDEELKMKSCILKNATPERLYQLIELNLNILEQILDYLIANDIHLFRISSGAIPFASHPINNLDWQNIFSNKFKQLGEKAIKNNIRLSMHPGQYTVINTENQALLEKSVQDLIYHTSFLDSMHLPPSNKVILHIGGIYNNKEKAMTRFIQNYKYLPRNIRSRLVIENDDKCYTANDVLDIARDIECPVVFDYLHFQLNNTKGSFAELFSRCRNTWEVHDGIQKIHYSEQAENKKTGSHSETINPEDFFEFSKQIPNHIDVMFEVKDKNLSVIKYKQFLRNHIDQP